MDFEVRPKDFNGFWSPAGGFGNFFWLHCLNISWFLLICLILTYLLLFVISWRLARKKLAPPLPEQVRLKNANRTRKLENKKVTFFCLVSWDWIVPSQRSNSGWSGHPQNHIFGFLGIFAIFGSPGVSRLASGDLPSLRPEHFNGFWSPAKGF